ncbi:hypothetical protein [Clostridium sp. BSD9I1]|nr:hypothetical protein [Clostridium sp. BSD9I1]
MKKAKKILCLLATVLISNALVPIHRVSAEPELMGEKFLLYQDNTSQML